MKKLYKAVTPEETIKRILDIIENHSLPVKEETLGDGDLFCSCRIFLSHNEDSSIGTNGKGMNTLFARASGYAEFMERIQNRVIVYPNPASIGMSCMFYPDEKPYSWNRTEAEENIRKFVPHVKSDQGLNADLVDGKLIPFYHFNKNEVEYVPYSLIRWINGSNGMCAGNITEEALIQGFNEIFERYSIQEMYIRRIVPPDVPLEIFEGTDILKRLYRMKEEYHMDFCVKDYSLGEGFPVLGLMVYSTDGSKYIMHLGADLNPVIALERCFTEIFQGYTAQTLRFENDINDCEKLNLFNEFKRSLMHGCGRLPLDYFTARPSYEYKGHTTIPVGSSFREDLNSICRWLRNKNYDIYIRDNSFFGFPTLQIVVPGMSEIDHTFCDLNRRIHHMQLTENRPNPLLHLHKLNEEECRETIAYLESLDSNGIDLFPRNHHRNNHVNRHLLLMLLYIRIGNQTRAQEQLDSYAASSVPEQRIKAAKAAFIQLSLHPVKALQAIAAPQCFDCDKCKVNDGCRYPLLREIEDITQKAMANYDFDQNKLKAIFNV